MESKRYPKDLSDEEWRCIGPHLPKHTGQGCPRLHGLRAILNAVFYLLKTGCPWRLLPKDLERLGKASTTGSGGGGASMAPSSASTPPCASCCAVAWVGIRSLVRASPTPKRPRRPASAANTEDTTATRRFEVGSV